ncbi:MAG: Fe-S-cluster-containing hydrogenase [Oligoflexia bacterium]|nr:Fe-S-cluster-containing hydrogenase [Oligoflexia bacterium]
MDRTNEKPQPSAPVSPAEGEAFVPPRHWLGVEELEPGYWADPAVREKRGQEFFEKPIEYLEKLEKSGNGGIARRDFLTIMGASLAMAGFACARRPVHKIIPYVVKPEEITLGEATWYASTSQACSCKCGILVKTREGRPIKLEGNPDHPLNRGALCVQGQASVLSLYDPDRLKAPIARDRATGARKEATWADVDQVIQAKLKNARSIRVLSGQSTGASTDRLLQDFVSGYADGAVIRYEPLALGELSEAQRLSYGEAVTPAYRFDEAELVVSLGADFLGSWLSPVEHHRLWAKGRKLDSARPGETRFSRLVCFESTMTLTGANADERHPVRPGDELKVALALAHQLLVKGGMSAYAKDPKVAAALEGYTAEAVAADLGLEGGAERLRHLADELRKKRGKSLVVAGGLHSRDRNALALQLAVNLLNSALENEGRTIDGVARAGGPRPEADGVLRLIGEMNAGKVESLIIYRSNPAFSLPKGAGFAESLKKVPLVVVVGEQEDETSLLADYVLPDHHPLENWGDASPRRGLYSLQQPAISPIHSSRAFEDLLLTWAKGTGKASGPLAEAADWHALLQANWRELHRKQGGATLFEQFWESVLRVGVFEAQPAGEPSRQARTFRVAALSELPRFAKAKAEGLVLALYASNAMGDGRMANNAWLQELPDPISSVTWDNYLNVSPKLARQLGLAENDVVELRQGDTVAELPVHVQPGMHPAVVSVAVGYGRRAAGRVGNAAGVDVAPFQQVVQQAGRESLIAAGQAVSVQKTGRIYRLAATQWHTATEKRPIINDITLAEFKKSPAQANHTDPHLRMEEVPTLWPKHEYKGHRWGMAIDLTACTGCSACMIGCQAENNVPVVGRDQVRVSRQMHWIRVDRYFSGTADRPDVVFQPMLCQHCENAPCETVCPVLATVHDDEGLNVQVYNRCVGTRYCQNNCPYKVRRFNFFDHWKSYEGPMNLVWNPDVTVRTRGIMEKCTFCVQRIREAKDKAKDQGVKLPDGRLKTACQQTCPTDAIVFGDVNDPESRVSKLRKDPRAFRVLEILNAKPMISYLTKVRNKEDG